MRYLTLILVVFLVVLSGINLYVSSSPQPQPEMYQHDVEMMCHCSPQTVDLFSPPSVPYDQLKPGRITVRTDQGLFPPVVPLSSFTSSNRI